MPCLIRLDVIGSPLENAFAIPVKKSQMMAMNTHTMSTLSAVEGMAKPLQKLAAVPMARSENFMAIR